MRSDDLTREQARALQDRLHPMLAYLNKLQHRMQSKGFPLDDPLWVTVSKAQQAIQELITELRCGNYRHVARYRNATASPSMTATSVVAISRVRRTRDCDVTLASSS